jgi:hypothetical protein
MSPFSAFSRPSPVAVDGSRDLLSPACSLPLLFVVLSIARLFLLQSLAARNDFC